MTDTQRLSNLYSSQPETPEQSTRRDTLISELELKLGIRQLDQNHLVVNGDLDDIGEFTKLSSR